MDRRWFLSPVFSLLLAFLSTLADNRQARAADPGDSAISFNRDIRSILAENCFACHGPDQNKREANLRMDTEAGSREKRDAGTVIVPGNPDASLLMQRILSDNPEERMPPPSTGKSITPKQVAMLKRWIASGASWEQHWSLIPPRRAEPPRVTNEAWIRNPIDRFILARLEAQQLTPSRDADRRTLARRLYFDLLGLPPSNERVEAFVADPSPDAYAHLVDELLRSEHFGERMALYWLDLVRYADTAGYHSDNHRDIAPYRDYVIRAFNSNKPFDQFTREQLAGDLMPNPTNEQRIASGFNRLLQTTEEGGAQPKEYTAKYAADRVRNTSVIWLGLTMGCSECHNHKYDPITTKDFYSFQAFFADIAEKAVGRQDQTPIPTTDQEQQVTAIDQQLTTLRATLLKPNPEWDAEQQKWEAALRTELLAQRSHWGVVKPEKSESTGGATLTALDDLSILSSGTNPEKDTYTVTLRPDREKITGIRLEALTHESLANKSLARGNGNFVLTEFQVEIAQEGSDQRQPVKIVAAVADFSQESYPVTNAIDGKPDTGWAVSGHQMAANRKAVFTFEKPIDVQPGTRLIVHMRHDSAFGQHVIGRFRLALSSTDKPPLGDSLLPEDMAGIVRLDTTARNAEQQQKLLKYFRDVFAGTAPLREQIASLASQREAITKAFPLTLVSMSVAPRMVRVLPRGNWLDDSGEVVEPTTPEVFGPLGVVGRRPTRLDLADWMTKPDNPLVARVFVNRLWKISFGQGIVKTVEDFGTQGELPSHPELLDWLAVEFRESGWNVKQMLKLLVTSHTYMQSSLVDTRLRELDPNNRLLARQSRYRVDAEVVRDNALAISGLLSPKIGGASVKPYQPAGYWANLNFPTREWQNDHGEDLYRRGLYTYWCRTFLNPSLLAFDAPTREECTADRARSNTPLQSLVLLNDPTYVEAARVFAETILRKGGSTAAERIHFAFRQAVQRAAREEEIAALSQLLAKHHEEYARDPASADLVNKVGERPMAADLNPADLAAWTSVARVILNLHETITRN